MTTAQNFERKAAMSAAFRASRCSDAEATVAILEMTRESIVEDGESTWFALNDARFFAQRREAGAEATRLLKNELDAMRGAGLDTSDRRVVVTALDVAIDKARGL